MSDSDSDDEYVEVRSNVKGIELTVSRRNLEREDYVDPCFFDEDYSIAASTGFTVWDGSWAFIKLLNTISSENGPAEEFIAKLRGARVVELGSGTGLGGLSAAAAGSHVLLTDLPQVTEGMLIKNIEKNSGGEFQGIGSAEDSGAWRNAATIGLGSAAPLSLDWRKSIQDQVAENDPRTAELILAVETVWLIELIEPFVNTTVALMHGTKNPPCYFLNGERAKATSETFASMQQVATAFEDAGCVVRQLCDIPTDDPGKPTKLYEIRLLEDV
ncbi:hypothetical protein CYMTET_27645 [Cymbomonas tetramitiformis]|uniref:Uncharacterized protein n=1 Tax=Cymbomonas tetramitiformis TaxID=36881 RepID=A0AAE0FPT1_9CHLO|nr:hypothetical protein CYMTET_27645 [Cymbomonas tetramitiformis]|eukprot:gene7147-8523_t